MSDEYLDFSGNSEKTGFRLQRLEILNWGTFDRKIWKLEARGTNTLLTGDIGSGKSTVVDAISTLLVPPMRLAYNKAAGAGTRERTLRSYVLGHYKSERGESDISSKAVSLRDANSYSVILGTFNNEGYGQTCTLAQVFWLKDQQGQPARLYVFANRALEISVHFSDFGTDVGELRKQLRQLDGVELYENFPAYSLAWMRVFGIENEQALELFNQTVSMKSVGNLTDFVREHMLEPFEGEARVKSLVYHFDDLDRAHSAVLRAKNQLLELEPIVSDCAALGDLTVEKDQIRMSRDAIPPWFSRHKLDLLERRVARLTAEIERLSAKEASAEESLSNLRGDRDGVKEAIATNGGDRLERLAEEIRDAADQRDKRRDRLQRYGIPARELGLPLPKDPEDFSRNRSRLVTFLEELSADEASLQNIEKEREFEFRILRGAYSEILHELESLRTRRNNIENTQVEIRFRLSEALGIPESSLPFAGELIRVKESEQNWEGAAERLLHSFALSLIVPEEYYSDVASWVDVNRLKGRLVYYRARAAEPQSLPGPHPDSILHKLEIKSEDSMGNWVSRELLRRFDYACCENLEAFRRERQALTMQGQLKSGGERHEKDDRRSLDDRSSYVLGWSNEAKIHAVEQRREEQERAIADKGAAIADIQGQLAEKKRKLEAVRSLNEVTDWLDLDWSAPSLRIASLEEEKHRLESSMDKLKTLRTRLDELDAEINRTESVSKLVQGELATAESRRSDALALKLEAVEIARQAIESQDGSFLRLDDFAAQAGLLQNLSVESCANRESELRGIVQGLLDSTEKRVMRLRDKTIASMLAFRAKWPLETREIDASVDAEKSWIAMLEGLRNDGLPRFERAFKELLNENTINEIANFQSQLNRERQLIRERIAHINKSLAQIDYNPGRYIVLEARQSPDGEIQDFVGDLRACTEGSLIGSGEDQYSEAKFLQVKRIIERFRGREGQSDADKRWTQKVSDVRQYFIFSASERWKENEKEYEHYTDSGGKSGGQKEKLAYTVLAASLAYQFGLEWGAVRSRSFRFVMIDEAFGRGSDESTRFGLELFKKMNLQLLIITPLQKIHVIEPYIASVGFVYNEEGRDSKMRNLSIGEYRAERDRRRAEQL